MPEVLLFLESSLGCGDLFVILSSPEFTPYSHVAFDCSVNKIWWKDFLEDSDNDKHTRMVNRKERDSTRETKMVSEQMSLLTIFLRSGCG